MKLLAFCVVALLGVLLSGLLGLAALVTIAAGAVRTASAPISASNPSHEAIEDIPELLLRLFVAEAQQCPGLPWTVMAGISKVESNHGRHGGSAIALDGSVQPPIIGIALDGTRGTARIRDTDDGKWDFDTVWDRAVGPFQFIPSSWQVFGADGNGDGVRDPNNVHDAIGAMRRHLCPDGQIADIKAAIFSYNHSNEYVALVLDWARKYTGPLTAAATPIAGYTLPVAASAITEAMLTRPHHTYPASDLPVPAGTPVTSIVAGTVSHASVAGTYPTDPNRCGTTITIAGIDGATYTYCHLSALTVAAGQPVNAGTLIGLSGGQPGAPGAGRTTGAHLHLGIKIDGRAVCPQALLLAIRRRTPINPAITPSTGCASGQATTDWPAWLDQLALTPPTGGSTGGTTDDG